jgi:predicted phosphohydrolase
MIFNYKNTRFFIFSDTHQLHEYIEIPQDVDVVICLGDAVEDNLRPQDYDHFLDWYASQPGKKFYLPGNHELIFEIAPKWGELLFKSDAIKLCLGTTEVVNGISLHFHYSADAIQLEQETDFLLTHYPPEMCDFVGDIRPTYHLYGHDHDTEGAIYEEGGTTFCNVCCYNSCYLKTKASI